jgi:hypothetical protein
MKKGKNVKLDLFNNVKSSYGTVDCRDFKSIYINLQSWVTPQKEFENFIRIVKNLERSIKHSVFNTIDENILRKNSIVDLDLRHSGITFGKKSFFNLEINLYLKKEIDFKSSILKTSVKKIITSIYNENIINNKYFDFSLNKEKTIKVD